MHRIRSAVLATFALLSLALVASPAAGQSRTITIASAGPLDPDTLRLRNLTDTYSES